LLVSSDLTGCFLGARFNIQMFVYAHHVCDDRLALFSDCNLIIWSAAQLQNIPRRTTYRADLPLNRYRSIFRSDTFHGRTYVVTGGGSGIGRCIAHELTSLGAEVAIVGRRRAKLSAVATELTNVGGQVSTHECDVRDEVRVESTIAAILARHGRIDGLCNNAGGQYPSNLEDISLKGWTQSLGPTSRTIHCVLGLL